MPTINIRRYVERDGKYLALGSDTTLVRASYFNWYLNHGAMVGVEAASPNFGQEFVRGLLVVDDSLVVTSSIEGEERPGMQRTSLLDEGYEHFDDAQIEDLGRLLASGKQIHLFPGTNSENNSSKGRVLVFSTRAPPRKDYERVRDLRAMVIGFQ